MLCLIGYIVFRSQVAKLSLSKQRSTKAQSWLLNSGHHILDRQSNGMLMFIASTQGLSEHTCTVHVGPSNEVPLFDILMRGLSLSGPRASHYHVQVVKSSSSSRRRRKSDRRSERRADARGNEGDAPVSSSRLPDTTFAFDVSLPCSQPFNFRLDGIRNLPIAAPACVAIS